METQVIEKGTRVKGKVALVTGAGSVGPGWGNGKAAAVQYARDGATIAAIDIELDAAQATVDLIRAEALAANGGYTVGKIDELIVPPGLGDNAGLLGALALALR